MEDRNSRVELQLPKKAAEAPSSTSLKPSPPSRTGRVACCHAKSDMEERVIMSSGSFYIY